MNHTTTILDECFTYEQFAWVLSSSEGFVRDLADTGVVPTVKYGKDRLIPKERAFDKWDTIKKLQRRYENKI